MNGPARRRFAFGSVAVALLAAGVAPVTADAASAGTVYVIQGIADQRVDLLVDSAQLRASVPAKTVVGPVSVKPGRHVLELRVGGQVVTRASFSVTAGASSDLVAHRFPDVTRAPSVTVFANDLSSVPPGKTRLLIAHTAVVGPADVVVNGKVLLSNLANGESATNVVPAATYTVSIVPTATTGPSVLGPVQLPVSAGTLTNVFAIGDPAVGTMDAVVQVLSTSTSGAAVPTRVNTGDGGQAAALVGSAAAAATVPERFGGGASAGLLAVGLLLVALLLVGLLLVRGGRGGRVRAYLLARPGR